MRREFPPINPNSLGVADALQGSESPSRRRADLQSAWVTRALYFGDFRPADKVDGSRDKYYDLNEAVKIRIEDILEEVDWLSRFPRMNIEVLAVIY